MIPAVLALILAIEQDTVGQDGLVQNSRVQDAAAPGSQWQDDDGLRLPDGRYLTGERATISFVVSDSLKAVRVLRTLDGATPLPGLPPEVPGGVLLVLAPDEAQFVRLTGGAAPDWGAGVALPAQSTIVIPAYASERGAGWTDARTLRHEWAHVGLHQYLEGLRLPRWFSEGYAQWASGGWDWSEGWKLRIALVREGSPLDSLTFSWPRDEARARTAYLLSATTVEYLVVEGGPRALEVLLRRWKDDGNFERAFRTTFGATTGQFEEDWRRYVEDRYGWLFVLSHSAVFWMALSLVLVAMVVVRRGARRERMARLRAADIPDRPSFWMIPGGLRDGDAGPGRSGVRVGIKPLKRTQRVSHSPGRRRRRPSIRFSRETRIFGSRNRRSG